MTALWFFSLGMMFFYVGVALGKISGRRASRGLKLEMEDLSRRMRDAERLLSPHDLPFSHGFASALTQDEHLLSLSTGARYGMDSIRTAYIPGDNDALQRSEVCEEREPDVTPERGLGEALQGKGYPLGVEASGEERGSGGIGEPYATSRKPQDGKIHIYRTLTWILRGGLTLAIAVNLIAMASALLGSGGFLAGIREVASWYSPLNVSTWLGELALFSPAWGAYLLREGLQ